MSFVPRYTDYISQVRLPGSETVYHIKDSEAREWIEQLASAGIKFTIGWDGESTPDVTKIPLGVTVTYQGQDYVGTLAASAETAPFINLVYLKSVGTAPNVRKIYEEYVTVTEGTGESGDPYTYFWELLGNTDISIDNLGDLAFADTASGSTTLSTADSATFSGGTASVSGTYTPAGTVSTPTISVTLATDSVQVKDSDGSVSAGSAASFTRGSFNGGSFTQGTDQFTAPTLTTTVSNETLTIGFSQGSFTQGSDSFTAATHGEDTFVANTPTAVTLPTFTAATVATGTVTSATSTQPTFSGTEATISSTGTSAGSVTLTKTDKTVSITVYPDSN